MTLLLLLLVLGIHASLAPVSGRDRVRRLLRARRVIMIVIALFLSVASTTLNARRLFYSTSVHYTRNLIFESLPMKSELGILHFAALFSIKRVDGALISRCEVVRREKQSFIIYEAFFSLGAAHVDALFPVRLRPRS